VALPVTLFVVTCLSTFWAGSAGWQPLEQGASLGFRQVVLRNWDQGLVYMACVLAILLTHELGHFIATLVYRVPASLPMFIPFPMSPIGTMGAVIVMDGRVPNRRQIFDIGIAGPIAGLVAALPILCVGISRLDLAGAAYGIERYDCPLLIMWLAHWLRPELGVLGEIRPSQLNPYFMAGWVGLLITGLNMFPVSQLDGGHVTYALFRRRAHWIARGVVFVAILYIVAAEAAFWAPMLLLVILLGTDHPPTADDRVQLGPLRAALGYASLLIPLVCFPPRGIILTTF
jgi:membrane-associated protease RseP (regulator of RpoE activity)